MKNTMLEVFATINKRRQSEGKIVNALTMFAEAWDYNKAEIAKIEFDNHVLKCKIDKLNHNLELLGGDD